MISAKIIGPVAAVTAAGLISWLCYSKASVGIARPSEPGSPRIDVTRDLTKISRSSLTGFVVVGGDKVSNGGKLESRNIFEAGQLMDAFRSSKTTVPGLIKMGNSMGIVPREEAIGLKYFENGKENVQYIHIRPGHNEELFGHSCGSLIDELWVKVSEK